MPKLTLLLLFLLTLLLGCARLPSPPPRLPPPPVPAHAVGARCLIHPMADAQLRLAERQGRLEAAMTDMITLANEAYASGALCLSVQLAHAVWEMSERASAALSVIKASVISAAFADSLPGRREACVVAEMFLEKIDAAKPDLPAAHLMFTTRAYEGYVDLLACTPGRRLVPITVSASP